MFVFLSELPPRLYKVYSAVWFTSIDAIQSGLPQEYKPEIVLLKKDMQNPQRAIEQVLDYYGMREQSWHTQEDIDIVLDVLSPSFNLIPSLSTVMEEQKRQFLRMTPEQSGLLDYLEEQRVAAIQGGAGTGKTLLAVEKAKRLAKTGKVLFLCFNRLLRDFLKKEHATQAPGVDFHTIYGLTTARKGQWKTREDITAYLNNYDDFNWDYKHVVVDEGQDFRPEEIKALSAIAEIQEGSFYVFYDRNQLVQQPNGFFYGITEDNEVIDEALSWLDIMDCRLILSKNCRNTKRIAETSYSPIGIEDVPMKDEKLQGIMPSLCIAKTAAQACARIAERIRFYTDQGLKQKDIVILSVKTMEISLLANKSSVGGYRLADPDKPDSTGILFTTSRKFKGRESPVVIVIDLDKSTFSTEGAKRLLYVGASRAKNYLDFIAVLNDNQLSEIAEQLTDKKQKFPRPAIAAQLKVKFC